MRAVRRLFPHVVFAVEAPDRLPLAVAPPDQQEIFGNLLENAGKWARGHVRIALAADRGQAVLTVEDDGAGVPAAQRERILQQGVRLDQSKGGSGLGLSIVNEIVGRYGGELTLDASPLGGLGARVTLPRGG